MKTYYIVKEKNDSKPIVYCETKEEAIAWRNNYNSSGIKKYTIGKMTE